jgi:hypothetical protein
MTSGRMVTSVCWREHENGNETREESKERKGIEADVMRPQARGKRNDLNGDEVEVGVQSVRR